MKDGIAMLVDKINKLEEELKISKEGSASRFIKGIDIENMYYKGIKITQLYEFYQHQLKEVNKCAETKDVK